MDHDHSGKFGPKKYSEQNLNFNKLLINGNPAILAHRGSSGGSIVDNTLDSARAALKQGADIVEIDVVMSTDGDFYCFHDGYEPMHFGINQNIHSLSTAQIEALNYNWACEKDYGVERLENLLSFLPNVLLNLDRSWRLWPQLLPYLDKWANSQCILLKSPLGSHIATLAQHTVKYPFMAICKNPEEVEAIRTIKDLNLIGIELIAHSEKSPFVQKEYITYLHQQRLFTLANALNLPDQVPLFAGMDDEQSVLEDPKCGWGRMADLGIDIIQTDWPLLLRKYLDGR